MAGGHDGKMVTRGISLAMYTQKSGDTLKADVVVKNRLPHAYPTGAPFRNFFLKVTVHDKNGKELWKNYKTHPIKDDKKSAFWYTLGDETGKRCLSYRSGSERQCLDDYSRRRHVC